MKRPSVIVIILLLLLAVVGVAYAASQPHSTISIQFSPAPGCIILDDKGVNITNGTVTLFSVAPLPGAQIVKNYSIENLAKTPASLTAITALPDVSGALEVGTAISGVTFPVALASLSTTPFTLTMTLLPGVVSALPTAITITATCA